MIPINCKRCKLAETRCRIVIGRGAVPADILFIGEGPGNNEDIIGLPFVGPSGKLLDRMIVDAELDSVLYYITNTVLCHPCDKRQGENRSPTQEEILMCASNLQKIISKVCPKVIVLVGTVAQKAYEKQFTNSVGIQHPAFILRAGGTRSGYYREAVIKLQKAKGLLYA